VEIIAHPTGRIIGKRVIGTDAHNASHLGYMEFGVNVARRGWLEKKDVMNSRSCRDVRFKS